MRLSCLRLSVLGLITPALGLLAACNPAVSGDVAGGSTTGTSGSFDKAAVVSYAHVLMTTTSATSTVGWKANGIAKSSGTTYLARFSNDTVRFASGSPLVTFEVTNGGTTRFLSEARLLVDGQKYAAFAFGVIGSTDPNLVPNFLLAPLDTLTPAAGKAHVRFAHLMPNVGPVDVWSGAPGSEIKVATALAYGGITAYADIQAATALVASINVTVTPTGLAPNAGTNIMTVIGVSNVTNPSAYTLGLLFTLSNASIATTRSIAIYQDR